VKRLESVWKDTGTLHLRDPDVSLATFFVAVRGKATELENQKIEQNCQKVIQWGRNKSLSVSTTLYQSVFSSHSTGSPACQAQKLPYLYLLFHFSVEELTCPKDFLEDHWKLEREQKQSFRFFSFRFSSFSAVLLLSRSQVKGARAKSRKCVTR
jgi:hypothetical protein